MRTRKLGAALTSDGPAHLALDPLYGMPPDASRRYAERIAAIGKEDVLRVARRVIRLDSYTEACIHP